MTKNSKSLYFLIFKGMSMKIFILFSMIFYCFSVFSNICDRTSIVKEALLETIEKQDCSEITDEDLKTVTTLDLSREFFRTGIQLKTNDFSGLVSLKQLNLSYNDFNSLPVGIFSGLVSLEELYLQYNNLIGSFFEGIFSDLGSLRRLYLSYNNAPFFKSKSSKDSTFPADIFSGLTLGIFSDLVSLRRLYLSHNNLSVLSVGVFSDLIALEWLYLGYNDLSSLSVETFSGLSSLEVLYLDVNDFSSLVLGVFSDLTSLESLYLGSNNLSLFPPGIFSPLVSLGFLGLDKNSIPESEQIRIQEEIPYASIRFWEQRLH